MDAPPPRKPGIKLKIPAGNVPSSYNAYPGQPQDEDTGGWSIRPPPIPPRPGQNPSTSSLPTTDRSTAPSTSSPSASCSSSASAYPAVMATPPPRRPVLNANSSHASSTSVPKLSLVTSRSSPAPPLSLNTSSTSASTTASGAALRAGAGATATPGKKPGLSLSLSIPTPGSKPGSAGPSHPSPVYDEFGGVQTAYHGGLRTPTTTRARNGAEGGGYDTTATGQTTIGQRTGNGYSYGNGYGEEDEGQKTIKGMTADLKNALSLMRITPTPTPGGSTRGSLDGGDGTIDVGQEGYAGSEGGSSGVGTGTGPGLGRSTSRGSASAGNAGVVKAGGDAVEDELDPRNYETLMRLGEGAGGAVEKVKDKRTGKILAMKVITTSPNPAIHKQLLRELQFLNECQSPYVVEHYGSFLTSSDTCIGILMEFCEAGSLDTLVRKITRRGGRTSEKVLGKIAEAVLGGLDYLHERRIIHRDIKPSNILVTKAGQVKLCDFGVSGELVDSFAGTFTGTSFYMAPERIQGLSYSIKSDIWSLGLTLHEVAHNRFPFPPEGEPPLGGPIELLNFIVAQPVPRLIDSPEQKIVWTDGAQDFLAQCLIRSANERPYPRDLLKHPWILESSKRNVNLAKWVTAIHGW